MERKRVETGCGERGRGKGEASSVCKRRVPSYSPTTFDCSLPDCLFHVASPVLKLAEDDPVNVEARASIGDDPGKGVTKRGSKEVRDKEGEGAVFVFDGIEQRERSWLRGS